MRNYLENENMPVDELPDDDGPNAPRQSYNFAPGYHGIVYRADTPDAGAGPRQHKKTGQENEIASSEPDEEYDPGPIKYKLQSMKWGLIPFWTKRNPDYGSMMKTINCRDDSLIESRGMWNTMKQRKRCVVVAEGFYEWLKKDKSKVPHYTKRKDGQLMCFAGLWDCVQYEGMSLILRDKPLTHLSLGSEDKHYTYTVITTDSNSQLKFLHDRMPVILENGSEDIRTWLDPKRYAWSKELQDLLRPFQGELECYPVSQEVGKVGNNSPKFIIPVASSENKSNIANFFSKPKADDYTASKPLSKVETENAPDRVTSENPKSIKTEHESKDSRETVDHSGTEDNAPLPVPEGTAKGVKRELEDVPLEDNAKKSAKTTASPSTSARKTRSAVSNNTVSPTKKTGSQKITNFFGK